jgi:hypothetical protein
MDNEHDLYLGTTVDNGYSNSYYHYIDLGQERPVTGFCIWSMNCCCDEQIINSGMKIGNIIKGGITVQSVAMLVKGASTTYSDNKCQLEHEFSTYTRGAYKHFTSICRTISLLLHLELQLTHLDKIMHEGEFEANGSNAQCCDSHELSRGPAGATSPSWCFCFPSQYSQLMAIKMFSD